ncbi:hypothetical protein TVAG_413490 [Trichomonas vaginalis G3]|uniref:DUF3447 domain-containing protein n=1 Tax=Trichomonas vaginalis (strain ATCC PRA-98 / G3) TaxID=412133 RepID=A2F9I2_TRIV3|nr:myotrophin family [Trichomonas vaginalis G3]EAX98453.1 hypothetical protein TVAG_413490 [Trichomonas vaginalis G3]KAI5493613.1 myotrophin family [Trichomonas vaginalis G3]|eukprot:XP_001311383.1 hypothetical protein [Trichomonas vaginalis G3]
MDNCNANSLYGAIINDDVKLFITFTERDGFDPNAVKILKLETDYFDIMYYDNNQMSFSLLEFCCFHGAVNCFKFLRTEYQSKITIRCLEYSFLSGVPDILNECLKYQNPSNECMKYAIISHNIDFVAFLANEFMLPIDPELCFKYNNILALAIHIDCKHDAFNLLPKIIWYKNFEFLDLIVWNLVMPNTQFYTGMPILHYAAKYNFKSAAKTLISIGVNVNSQDYCGNTALHVAAERDSVDVVNILINHGIDINKKNNDGKTALHYASANHNFEIVKVLIMHGAVLNLYDKNGKTPFHYATMYSRGELKIFISSCLFKQMKHYISNVISNIDGKMIHEPDRFIFAFRADFNKSEFDEAANAIILNGNKIDINVHNTSERKSIEIAKLLVSNGADVNAKDFENRKTPLHYAAERNCQKLAEFLISHGANINAKNKHGLSAIHYAAGKENKELIEILISHGADVNSQDNFQITPLHISSFYNLKDITKLLISHGADINKRDKERKTPLHYATKSHSVESAQILISHGANVNLFDFTGKTPLHFASMYYINEIKDLLLANDDYLYDILESLEERNNIELDGIRLSDKSRNHMENAIFLISNGSFPSKVNSVRNASERKSIEIAKLLVSNGADVNAKDFENRKTPLHYAAERNCQKLAEFLISHGANINAKNKHGLSAIHYAAGKENKELIEILISHGADVNSQDNFQITPLHISSFYNLKDITKLLISHGADVNSKDNDDITPLHLVCVKNFIESAQILLSNGAHARPLTKAKLDPSMLAYGIFDPRMKLLLLKYRCINAIKIMYFKLRNLLF